MPPDPWQHWIPGALSKQQVQDLLAVRNICGDFDPEYVKIDTSSMDLRLSDKAWLMLAGSIKPMGGGYQTWLLSDESLARPLEPDTDGCFTLEPKKTYVFRLQERLARLQQSPIYGRATAKSSIGRMDVLARLIVDGMTEYECFNPESLSQDDVPMYLEVTPITFRVRVKPGISLSQLRLFHGPPEEVEIHGETVCKTALHSDEREICDATLTVDLKCTEIGDLSVAAFVADRDNIRGSAIDLWGKNHSNPLDYWKTWPNGAFPRSEKGQRLRIKMNRFYILRSKERISLPKGLAVYCRAMDEAIGEMRIHYAGFVHPWFGSRRSDSRIGTPLIFEVRGHNVEVSLADGEKMARLIFYRMSEDAQQDDEENDYNEQELKLSKFFTDWNPNPNETRETEEATEMEG